MKACFFLIVCVISLSVAQASDYNILNFGAKVNTLATKEIQMAIDDCFKAGGGRVIVPAGKFISGTIELKSNVELHLESGSVIEGSTNLQDYRNTFKSHGIIFCIDSENVTISGNGSINARGIDFYDPQKNHVYDEFNKSLVRQKENYMPEGDFFTDGPIARLPKPGMSLTFYNCSRLVLKDFKLIDTPSWGIRIAYCDDVKVSGLSILNNLMIPNSDGIHCTASRNVMISDCDIRAGDDAIIVTGFPMDEETPGIDHVNNSAYTFGNKEIYSENFVVTNCLLQSRSSGIRVGYGQHPIRRCSFNNIVIYGSNRGIGVFAHDAASIEDLIFSDIIIQTRLHNGQWWGNGEPIHISAVSRFESEPAGTIKNVQFNNIIATSEHGILIYAIENSPMENISFMNVNLKIVNGKETLGYGGNFDLRPVADTSLAMFEHDIPGLYAQFVNNLSVQNFKLEWGDDLPSFFTHGIECKDVNDLSLSKVEVQPNPGSTTGKKLNLTRTKMLR